MRGKARVPSPLHAIGQGWGREGVPVVPADPQACQVHTLGSPDTHLAVHHAGRVEGGQKVVHLVVALSVLHHVPVVGGHEGLQHVGHQPVQAALLTLTVLLQDPAIGCRLEAPCGVREEALGP